MKKSILSLALALQLAMPAWAAGEIVEVYKSPSCGCCAKWVQHMQKAGFEVRSHDVDDVAAERARLGMPERYASCHTAKVGAYLIEGHVPADDVKRLLKEKPKAIGLAVPGMPRSAPGMDSLPYTAYDTLLVQSDRSQKVYAQH
jgi:hypothetical protein